MYVSIARMDEPTRDYLRSASETQGGSTDGVFCKNGRVGFLGRLICAILFLGVWAFIFFGLPEEKDRVPWAVGCFAIGVAFLTSAVLIRRQWATYGDFGAFSLLDGRFLWEMGGSGVNVVDHTFATTCNTTHHYSNGAYTNTSFKLDGPGGTATFSLATHARAEEAHRFLQVLFGVRERLGPDAPPEIVGAVARKLIAGEDLNEVAPRAAIPIPADDPEARKVPGQFAPWVALLAAAALSWVGFPPIADYMYEEHRYGEAIKSANVAGYSHYLNEFPNGRHAEEIVVLLDDANFAEAQRASTDAHSPAGLRAYLSDSRNKRHVAEAQKQINVYYEEAIARLKSAAEGKNVDQELFQGLLGLLEWVKTQPAPVVPVAFAAEQEAETKNDEVRSEIELAKSFYKEKNPELNSIPNDGVIGQGDVFGDEPTRTREEVILQRVRASVQNVLGADVVTFERAKEGEQAMLDVHYHIEPSGNVYLYTTTNEADPALIVGRKVNGLLLGYGVGWRITLRGAAGAEHVFVVGSQPASSLNYSSDSSDPEWAPYAVLLLSAFYDMSNQMVSNFAIEPPPAPTHFTFRDATTDVSGAALPNPFMPEMPDLPTLPDDVTGRPFDPTAPLTPGKMPPLFDPNNPTSPDLPPLPDLPSLPGVPSPPEIPSPPGSPGAPGPLGESPSDGAGPQDRSDPTTNPSVAPTEIEASPPSTGAP